MEAIIVGKNKEASKYGPYIAKVFREDKDGRVFVSTEEVYVDASQSGRPLLAGEAVKLEADKFVAGMQVVRAGEPCSAISRLKNLKHAMSVEFLTAQEEDVYSRVFNEEVKGYQQQLDIDANRKMQMDRLKRGNYKAFENPKKLCEQWLIDTTSDYMNAFGSFDTREMTQNEFKEYWDAWTEMIHSGDGKFENMNARLDRVRKVLKAGNAIETMFGVVAKRINKKTKTDNSAKTL